MKGKSEQGEKKEMHVGSSPNGDEGGDGDAAKSGQSGMQEGKGSTSAAPSASKKKRKKKKKKGQS